MIRVYQYKKFAEEHGIPMKEAMSEWKQYARARLEEIKMDVAMLLAEADEADDVNSEVYAIWAVDLISERDIIRKDWYRANDIANPKPQTRDRKEVITDDMIWRAKNEVPIESVIEFNREGKALAFCHGDTKPSLSWDRKRNRAHCFVCPQDFNPVDVLMKRDNFTFVEAVKYLNRC